VRIEASFSLPDLVEVSYYEYKYICIREIPNATRPVRCRAERYLVAVLPLDGATSHAIVDSTQISFICAVIMRHIVNILTFRFQKLAFQ